MSGNYRESVKPVRGAVVYCDLAGALEHSGICLGGDQIIHLNGKGLVEAVSADQFTERLDGCNPHSTIYVSCDDLGVIASDCIAQRAEEMLGKTQGYHVVMNNCHNFVSSRVTGFPRNGDGAFWAMEHTMEHELGTKLTWRKWDR